jgi:hypothetical protein
MGASARQFNTFKPASVNDYANRPPQSYASTGGMPPQQNYKQPMPPSSPSTPPQMGQSLFDQVSGGQTANINDPAPSGPAPWMSGGVAPGFTPTAMPMQSLPMQSLPMQSLPTQPPPQAASGGLDQSSLLNAINAPQSATLSPGNVPTPSVMPASQPAPMANGATISPAFAKTQWR